MLAKVTTTLTGLRARTSCTLALRHSLPRSLSNTAAAATESTRTNEDLVKAAVHRMMLEQQASAGVTEEALQKASYCLRVSFVVAVAAAESKMLLLFRLSPCSRCLGLCESLNNE